MKLTSQILSLTSFTPTLTGEDGTEIDLAAAEAEAATPGDGYGLVVERVVQFVKSAIGAR